VVISELIDMTIKLEMGTVLTMEESPGIAYQGWQVAQENPTLPEGFPSPGSLGTTQAGQVEYFRQERNS
jgi:hypothetical protein